MKKVIFSNPSGIATPEVVVHQGKSICIVKRTDPEDNLLKFFYCVLSPRSMEDANPARYVELPIPDEQSMAGYNLLRTGRLATVSEEGCFKVVSDQQYIYLFFSSAYTLYTCRYMAKEVKDAAGDISVDLEPAWEVRFKRSRKPDTPYSDTDVSDFADMEGIPFFEPLYALPFGKKEDFEIKGGAFSVELVPTQRADEKRWQIFTVNAKTGRLQIYSFGYGKESWLQVEASRYDAESGHLKPDCILDLYTLQGEKENTLQMAGIPSSLLYNKKEPVNVKEGGHVNLNSSYKIKLLVPLWDSFERDTLTADLDFCIDLEGNLIYPGKKPEDPFVRYEAGYTEPIDCSISFKGGHVQLPVASPDNKQSSFIQQLWVYPEQEEVERQYLIGSSTSSSSDSSVPLSAVWIQYGKKIGFGFNTPAGLYGGITKNNVLTLHVWNNIAVVFDGTRYSVYVNGSPAELETSYPDTQVREVQVFDALGAGYEGEKKQYFKGYLDDVRIWKNADALDYALSVMSRELREEEITKDLLGYWKFYEGQGPHAENSSTYSGLDGKLISVNWESAHSPIKTAFEPTVYVDKENFLSLEVAVIDPEKTQAYPDFICSDLSSRVHLLSSADGKIHAYYKGINNYFYTALYDPLAVKAVFTIPCMGDCQERHYVDFISRRSGSVVNVAGVRITRDTNPYLCTVSFRDGTGYTECWKGIPVKISPLMQILNGQAFSASGYTDQKENQVFYDYSGLQYLAYQPYGEGDKAGQILFIGGKDPKNHICKITGELSSGKMNISVSYLEDEKEKSCRFESVSSDTQSFLLTLRGFDSNYPYTETQRKVLALLDLYQIGPNGTISGFECELGRLQGVEVAGGRLDAETGSNLFVAYSNQQGEKVHDESVDFGSSAFVEAELRVFGQDGGWVTQAPKQEIYIPFRGTLQVPVDTPDRAGSFDLSGDLTMETWVRGGTEMVDNSTEYEYQRIFHAHPSGDSPSSACMLGITPSICMNVKYRTKIETTGCEELFRSGIYSVMFYVKPNLETVVSSVNRFYTCVREDGYEALLLNDKGHLTLEVKKGSKIESRSANNIISSEKWSMITMTRQNAEVHLYIDGEEVFFKTDLFLPVGNARLYLGGNENPSHFETRISNFSVWNRVLDASEISNRYMKLVSPDADGLTLLWEMNDKKNPIPNTAVKTAGRWNGIITGDFAWRYPGLFYRAFGAAGEKAAITRNALIDTGEWNHIAFCRQMEYGIRTGGGGSMYAECPDSPSFHVATEFTIEGWILPDPSAERIKQGLFSKFSTDKNNRSFEFGRSYRKKNDLYLIVSLCDKNGKRFEKEFCTNDSIDITASSCVTVTVQIVNQNTGSGENMKMETRIKASFYVNGKGISSSCISSGTSPDLLENGTTIAESTVPVCLGRTRPDGIVSDQAFFSGIISSFSFFSTYMEASAVFDHYNRPTEIIKQKSLVSRWLFREQSGVVSKDAKGSNDLALSQSGMWCSFPEASRIFLMVNGKQVETDEVSVYSLGGYGDDEQVRFGNQLFRGAKCNIFNGEINEFRLWSVARTGLQVTENMYGYLTGREKGLNAYWTFESEGGDFAVDLTGKGHEAFFVTGQTTPLPEWRNSDAPQQNEMPFIVNAIGGKAERQSILLTGSPAVTEYACTEYDYYESSYDLMKRGYLYPGADNRLVLDAGFKIGDLKRIYMGQVQSAPTIVGFIEGTPPLPSENLTRPYYLDPASSDYFAYDDCSSVALTEEKGLEVSLSSSKEKTENYLISTDDYALTNLEFNYGKALGVFFSNKTFTNDVRVGGHYDEERFTDVTGDSRNSVTRLNSSVTSQLSNRGEWEQPNAGEDFLMPGKRRYIPRNEGLALVKSSTVDAYILLLENTGAMVGMAYELNRDIPEDFNFIHFPIDPRYVKNGTLDGKVGLQNDENYPGADQERGSYFKPVESYSLKKEIERENHKLAARYAQFTMEKPSDLENNESITNQFAAIEYYDQAKELFKKNIVNEYIWTAAGGFYSQSDQYVSSIQESYSANYSKGHDDTGGFSIEFTCFLGLKTENTFTRGHHWTLNMEKSKNVESSIQLDVSVAPDPHLGALTKQSDGSFVYSSTPEPGKVSAYRFNTFYLASSKDNYQALFSKVIDKGWLASNHPDAKALRQAQSKEEGSAYRIFHRVTYVNRIAPEYQNFPLESNTAKTTKPIDLVANNLLLTMVDDFCQGDPAKIGMAIKSIFEEGLKQVIPGWENFLTAARTDNSPEYFTLIQLKEDTAEYMQTYYATKD